VFFVCHLRQIIVDDRINSLHARSIVMLLFTGPMFYVYNPCFLENFVQRYGGIPTCVSSSVMFIVISVNRPAVIHRFSFAKNTHTVMHCGAVSITEAGRGRLFPAGSKKLRCTKLK